MSRPFFLFCSIMNVSIDFIKQKFEEYNIQMFEGKLPPLEIRLSSAKTFMGTLRYIKRRKLTGGWEYHNFQLVISTRFEVPENVIEDTVIHEMIHYYILYHGILDTSTHGVIFQEMMNRINKYFNRHITISIRLPEEIRREDMKIHTHLVCISHFNDGRVGVTVAVRSRWQYLRDMLPTIPNVTDCTWYITQNPFFNSFPRSMTPKIYIVTEAELEKSLKDAIPM